MLLLRLLLGDIGEDVVTGRAEEIIGLGDVLGSRGRRSGRGLRGSEDVVSAFGCVSAAAEKILRATGSWTITEEEIGATINHTNYEMSII